MSDPMKKSKTNLKRRETEEALESFLDSQNEHRVFALKGKWGVGKTHLVKTLLSKRKKEYYYASAFGISSVNELKMQLWSNLQSVKEEEKNGLFSRFSPRKAWNHTKSNSEVITKLIAKIPLVGDIGGIVTSSTISLISHVLINSMLKGQLICIDDLERRSKNLQLDELLGFVESLVERDDCKIILIYHEDRINEDKEAEKILGDYREKVIDVEIELAPTTDENFSVGFGKDYPDEEVVFNYLNKQYVQTNNIRVLKKLRWFLEKLRPHIKDFLLSTRSQIIKEAIFIVLAKFDKKFPVNLNRLLFLGDHSSALTSKNEEDRSLYLSAIDLGYSGSVISEEIIRLVETSVCDYERLVEKGRQLNDREEKKQIKERLSKAHEPYFESFGSSEQELRDNLAEFLDNYCIFLDFPEFAGIEKIARAVDLNLPGYKKIWLKSQIDNSNAFSELDSLRSILKEFPDLMAELEEKLKGMTKTTNITQVLGQSLEKNLGLKRHLAIWMDVL